MARDGAGGWVREGGKAREGKRKEIFSIFALSFLTSPAGELFVAHSHPCCGTRLFAPRVTRARRARNVPCEACLVPVTPGDSPR